MSARVLLLAVLQVIALWGAGLAVVHLVTRARKARSDLAAPERALLGIAAGVAFAVALMGLHVATGGRAFSNRFAVPLVWVVLVGASLLSWDARARWDLRRIVAALRRHRLIAVLGAVLVLVYAVPAIVAGSGVRTGDPPWHLGWTYQLLGGEALPVGPAPEFARNAYPWGFHAVLATMARVVPGSDPLIGHEALHLLLVAALPLSAASLARSVSRRAGIPAAVAMSLVGGWGWLDARRPLFFPSPRYATAADPAVGSPNAVYEMFPPAFPRELGLVLVAAAGVLIFRALETGSIASLIAAGAAVGLAGLVSLPMFVAGMLWVGAATIWMPGMRFRAAATMAGVAAIVLALWAAPVVWSYIQQGGFVNVSPRLGREWPLGDALGSWGLLAPVALVGVLVSVRSPAPRRALLGFAVATSGFLVLAVLRSAFGWGLAGQATLFHQGRVWPVAHLLGAAMAGVGVGWAIERGPRWMSIRTLAALLGALAAVAAVSPVLASVQLTRFMEERRFGFVYSDPEVSDPDSFVRRAAAYMGPRDIVAVDGSDDLAFLLFQFSGVRLARYDDPGLDGNDLRIRFRRNAEAWERRMRAGGFAAGFTVRLERETPPPGWVALASGVFRGRPWVLYEGRGEP